MQGLFFSEFHGFAGRELGIAPEPIAAGPGGGRPGSAYRPLERYPEAEFASLVERLAEQSHLSRAEVLRRFGRHLFGRLVALFPVFFEGVGSALDLLGDFERLVHDEVRRLDGRLDPPRLECRRSADDRIEIVYRSRRNLADLAEGLILGCAAHFDEPICMTRLAVGDSGVVCFSVRRGA
jgi:Haem-NO-binding